MRHDSSHFFAAVIIPMRNEGGVCGFECVRVRVRVSVRVRACACACACACVGNMTQSYVTCHGSFVCDMTHDISVLLVSFLCRAREVCVAESVCG